MPQTDVVFYQEDRNDVPVLDWLKELRRSDQRAYESCVAAIARLAEFGHQLRRPLADTLRDGIYELRASLGGVHHRILYFFQGAVAAVVSHGLAKERVVPPKEIDRAVERKKRFEANPAKHTYEEA